MSRRLGFVAAVLVVVALAVAYRQISRLWAAGQGESAPVLITEPIDETKLITLRGNTRPEARVAAYDRGRVEDGFAMDYLLLQLRRPPELERAFEQYIDSLTDKSSPNFHHWLTADQQGQQYGLAQQDLDVLVGWLSLHGFTVDRIYPNTLVIAFSGTAGEILEAFHTEIHYLDVKGESHYANVSDPKIPEALAPAVVGVVSMHNFKPHAMIKRAEYTFGGCNTLPTQPGYDSATPSCYALVPADFQTIYNAAPLFRLGILGQGQTIAVVEDSDTYTPSGGTNDVTVYRNTFLSKYSGTVTTTHPGGCTNPGANGADSEADLDAEVASAIAPDATIEVATCADTSTFGGLIAIENLVSAGSPPAIISMSYGVCEAANYLPSNAAFNTAFQSAAAAGVSVFASAGDSGASTCARDFTGGESYAYPGIGVTGWGESVYNVSVGGTDFQDVYNAKEASPVIPLGTYWNSSSGNSGTDGSAKSYIPEIPWNDSCASALISNYVSSSLTTYGSSGFCNSSNGTTNYLSTAAGSGGPSGCATGSANSSYLYVEGSTTCAGYAKPAWQSGIFGNPNDGVRDIPDVSLFAANGIWGHYIVVCFSDPSNGGTSCSGAPSSWSGFGGTSASAPMMAGIQALVNQKWNMRAGNPNPIYYKIAKAEFGASGNSACYSINQPPRRGLGTSCAFYDITQGDIDVDCVYNGTAFSADCYVPSGTYGTLGTQAITGGLSIISGGSGYTSTPTCSLSAPTNLSAYHSPSGGTIWAGGTQATCTVTISGGVVNSITLTNPLTNLEQGYTDVPVCTISGGGGSGATCLATITPTTGAAAYQPAFGATPGWDFATGIGSVNAYNLVFNSAW